MAAGMPMVYGYIVLNQSGIVLWAANNAVIIAREQPDIAAETLRTHLAIFGVSAMNFLYNFLKISCIIVLLIIERQQDFNPAALDI